MSRRDTHGDICDLSTSNVGTSAALILAAGGGRIAVTVKNTHATQTIALGPSSSVTTAEGTHFIGAGAVAANGGTFTLTNYSGSIYGLGSGASTTYTLEVIRASTRAD